MYNKNRNGCNYDRNGGIEIKSVKIPPNAEWLACMQCLQSAADVNVQHCTCLSGVSLDNLSTMNSQQKDVTCCRACSSHVDLTETQLHARDHLAQLYHHDVHFCLLNFSLMFISCRVQKNQRL